MTDLKKKHLRRSFDLWRHVVNKYQSDKGHAFRHHLPIMQKVLNRYLRRVGIGSGTSRRSC